MALDKFNARLALELPNINSAIMDALLELPGACLPVAEHVVSAGGKRLRPLLAVLSAALFGSRDPAVYRLAASMELLHAATLLHDDILDSASTRRGKPAAHVVYGQSQVILAGDALLALGNAIVASSRNSDMSAAYSRAIMATAAGEIMEMNSLGSIGEPLDAYLEIARGKTACLIAQSCVLGALFAGTDPETIAMISEFGENLGMAFQLVDDALDFAPETQTGKPSGGDLREGKMTIPVRLYRESLAEAPRREFDRRFADGEFTDGQLAQVCSAIAPFARASLKYADDCLASARSALTTLPQNEENMILAEITEYVRNRQK